MNLEKQPQSPPPLSAQPSNVLSNGPRFTTPIPTPTMYQLPFPDAFERALAPLDDSVVRVVQRRTQGTLHMFVMSLTFFSAIEMSLTAPATLYALGYDRAAGMCFSVLWVLCIVSQIPKKFIFRRRPWMSGRALPIRQDRTSSFPSRAVVCAVVFSWLIGQSLFLEQILPGKLPRIKLWVGIVISAALTAFARINVGAHYASDTICGFLLGLVIIRVGMKFEGMWQLLGCGALEMYPKAAEHVISNFPTLGRVSFGRLFFATIVSFLLTWISVQGFWVKCSYVYGLLLGAATFRVAFLCSGPASTSAIGSVYQVLDHGNLQTHLRAIVTFLTFLLFGMATKGRQGPFRIAAFGLIYFGTLVSLLCWRLTGSP